MSISLSKRWSPVDTEALSKLRRALYNDTNANNIALLNSQPQYPEVIGDRRLLRYIKAAKYDINTAKENYLNTLKFRKQYNVNAIRNDIVFGGKNCPNNFPNGSKILSYFKTIILSADHRDVDGNPISYEDFSSSPSTLIANVTKEEYIIFTIYCLEYKSLILEQVSDETEQIKINRRIAKMSETESKEDYDDNANDYYGTLHYNTFIRNFSGLSFDHIGNGQIIIGWIIHIAQAHYPEILGQSHMCNTPFIFEMIWVVIKQFLDNQTLNKIKFYGTDFQTHLLKRVSVENFPSDLDSKGTLSFDVNKTPFNFDVSPSGPLHYPDQPESSISDGVGSNSSSDQSDCITRIESNFSLSSYNTDTGSNGSYNNNKDSNVSTTNTIFRSSIFSKIYKNKSNKNNGNISNNDNSAATSTYESNNSSSDSYESSNGINDDDIKDNDDNDNTSTNIITRKDYKSSIMIHVKDLYTKIINYDIIADCTLMFIVLFDIVVSLFTGKLLSCNVGKKEILLQSPKTWILYLLLVFYGKMESCLNVVFIIFDSIKGNVVNLVTSLKKKVD